MSYGFVYDSDQTEEYEIGTEYGRKTDLILLTVFLAIFAVAVLVRVFIFPQVSLSDILHKTAAGNTVTAEDDSSQIGFDVADHTEKNEWQVMNVQELSDEDWKLLADENASGALIIALPEGMESIDYLLANYYRDRAFTVTVTNASKSAVSEISIYSDGKEDSTENLAVCSAAARYSENGLQISATMNGLYEYKTSVTDGKMIIYYFSPSDIYDKVVVIDPVKSDYLMETDGEDITAMVAEEVEKIAAEQGIKVYITRDENEDRSNAERFALMADANPDLVIQIGESDNADTGRYGLNAYYNGRYCIPEMSNAAIAESLLRNTAIETSNRAESIAEADSDNILMLLDIPSAGINIGYISNEEERTLMENSEYRGKIAEGIAAALQEIWKNND